MRESYQKIVLIDKKAHEEFQNLESCVQKAIARRLKESMDDMQHKIESEIIDESLKELVELERKERSKIGKIIERKMEEEAMCSAMDTISLELSNQEKKIHDEQMERCKLSQRAAEIEHRNRELTKQIESFEDLFVKTLENIYKENAMLKLKIERLEHDKN